MEPTPDTDEDENLWLDSDGELRWEAVTRTLAFVAAVGAVLAATGVWLLVSGQLLIELCQSARANTDKALLDACQGRLDDGAPHLNSLAGAIRPAAIALAGSFGAVLVQGAMLLLGAGERTKPIAASVDTPATWVARLLVTLAAFATAWLAVVSVERLLSLRALM